MTPPVHAALREKAEAIGPVEWHAGHLCRDDHPCQCAYIFDDGHMGGIATIHVDDGRSIADGGSDYPSVDLAKAHQVYIAAANPAAVLALLDDNARLREALSCISVHEPNGVKHGTLNDLIAVETVKSARQALAHHPERKST